MMKIEDIVDDIVLLILAENEPLKELGISQNKLFAKVTGYDENNVHMVVRGDGKVGIGDTAPNGILHVAELSQPL